MVYLHGRKNVSRALGAEVKCMDHLYLKSEGVQVTGFILAKI